MLRDTGQWSSITPLVTSTKDVTVSPSLDGSRRRQQVTRLSFVRKSPNRMLRPQLTSVSYTVRHDGRRRGRKTSRKQDRRRKQPRRLRTTSALPPYDGQTLDDFCPSGRLVVTVSAVMKLSRCLGIDMREWLHQTTIVSPHGSVGSIFFLLVFVFMHVTELSLDLCNIIVFKFSYNWTVSPEIHAPLK